MKWVITAKIEGRWRYANTLHRKWVTEIENATVFTLKRNALASARSDALRGRNPAVSPVVDLVREMAAADHATGQVVHPCG